MFEQAYTLASL